MRRGFPHAFGRVAARVLFVRFGFSWRLAVSASKPPSGPIGFPWISEILATTLCETAVSGHVFIGPGLRGIFETNLFSIFLGAVFVQVRASLFNAYLYWLTIVATTTLGTTIADFVDRSLGVGYLGGSSIVFIAVVASLAVWRLSEGTVSVNTVATPRVEAFYWITILFSQTLGTALGDWVADTNTPGPAAALSNFGSGDCLNRSAVSYFSNQLSSPAIRAPSSC